MRVWLKQLGVALLYLIAGLLTQQTFKLLGTVSIVWPGSGLALAVLLIGGRRYLWGVFLGSLLLNAIGSDSLWTLGGITLGHVLEPLVAFSLCTRYALLSSSLRTLLDYFKLIILGGALGSTVGAVIGSLSLLLAGFIKLDYLAEVIIHWWMGDTLGVLLVTPLILSWQQEWLKKIPTRKLLEGMLLIAITFLVGQIVFFEWFREYLSETPKGYLLFLCVSWVAIRMGARSTTLVLWVIAAQALTSIYYQVGIFSHDVITANLQNYWAYMLTLSIVGMAVTISVNELVHTYNALNESELRYRALFENAGDSIFLMDGKRFIDCNPAALNMFGCTRDLIIGEPPYRFSPELQPDGSPSKEKTLEKIHDALLSEIAPFEWQHCRCDGTLFEAEVTLNPVKIGEDQYLLASVRDISARKEAEDSLRRLNEELESRVEERTSELAASRDEAERANEAKSEFLSRMSHELRTPLNAILGFSQLLNMGDLKGEQKDNVREILHAGQHLLNLINEVLDLARIESGKFTVSKEPVPLLPLIADCLTLIRPQAEGRGIRVVEAGQTCGENVLADRTRLKQVMLNLLSNAVKYNRAKGTISIVCVVQDDLLQIRISDTGEGITAEQQARLFVAFERLNSDQHSIEGTGIGLALSKRLVELMGGEIGVESTPGTGSTFWVRLPIATGYAEEPHADQQDINVHDTKKTSQKQWDVLCIEDNPANMRLIESIIGLRQNIRLLTAGAPGLGLELAESHRPALILVDINLPDMDGYAVMQCLREKETTRDIPVVAISANAMPKDLARGKAAGFAEYLTKPLDVDKLLQVVDDIIAKRMDSAPGN